MGLLCVCVWGGGVHSQVCSSEFNHKYSHGGKREITLTSCPLTSTCMPGYVSKHRYTHTLIHTHRHTHTHTHTHSLTHSLSHIFFLSFKLAVQQLETGASLGAGHRDTPQAFKPTLNKEAKKKKKKKKKHTERDPHTSKHTKSAQHVQLETNHGNCDLAVPLSPSRQSGHLINVTQHPILLHCVFLHSVPVGSPEAHFHCKLLVSGKLSKAFDWREGGKPLPELPHAQPPSSSGFSLVLYSTSPHTQIMLWKSFTGCHLRIKKKKKKGKEKERAQCPCVCNCPKRIIHFCGGYGWSPECIPTPFSCPSKQ